MNFFWPADDAAAVVRSRFDRANWPARVVAYRPVEVTTDESDLVVRFRYEGHPELFAVRFSLARMPEGPQTGEVCESLGDWAQEVDWVRDEGLNTRMVDTAERTVADDGWSPSGGETRRVHAKHALAARRGIRISVDPHVAVEQARVMQGETKPVPDVIRRPRLLDSLARATVRSAW